MGEEANVNGCRKTTTTSHELGGVDDSAPPSASSASVDSKAGAPGTAEPEKSGDGQDASESAAGCKAEGEHEWSIGKSFLGFFGLSTTSRSKRLTDQQSSK